MGSEDVLHFGGNNRTFSSLFPVRGEKTNEVYEPAIAHFGLDTEFVSISSNLIQLRKDCGGKLKRLKGPEDSCILDVPGKGDCWAIALLAKIIGFVIDQ